MESGAGTQEKKENRNYGGGNPDGGVGAFTDTTRCKASVVRIGKYSMWHRVELDLMGEPLYLAACYFPQAKDKKWQAAANEELAVDILYYKTMGHVIIGGDMNAHTGSNFDTLSTDTAGQLLLATLMDTGMLLINTMGGKCKGGPSRVQVRSDGIQMSTLDYVTCSPSVSPHVYSLTIEEDSMDSDHRPLVLRLHGLHTMQPERATARSVWRLENIPDADIDLSWVTACRTRLEAWMDTATDTVPALDAVKADSARIADVLEWSFQHALDEVADERLGTRRLRPKATPALDAVTDLLVQQRMVCEEVLKRLVNDNRSSDDALATARGQFLASSRAVRKASSRRRELEELCLFRDVEEKQSDSKVFWGCFKTLRNSIKVPKTPPPIIKGKDGKVVTDPIEMIRSWCDFSATIDSADLRGTAEEGAYDEAYKIQVEQHLVYIQRLRDHQPLLDRFITQEEVWRAIRKLHAGKAPGEDGILTDIIKSAADALGKSKLKPGNTVITPLTLLFNFVLEREVWPDRLGSGIIFPLHKADSRLDPSNYRPITLMSVVGKLFGSIVNARLQDFSERTGSIADEQGGFRPKRGTSDQIFLLREILESRRERGAPTYATYIDARKAYDTVWREDMYVRIHDSGVRGKLWRQIQVVHKGLSRRVQLPLGLTDLFPVERGVAQGAVESPWMYSNFINGLVEVLKASGFASGFQEGR
jgi:hypothetical protein